MKQILITVVIILLFSSCKTQKPIVTKEIITKIDTVYIDRIVTTAPPVNTLWEKEDPCDSITGSLRDFERIVDNGSSRVVVRSEGGILRTVVTLSGSTESLVKEHRSSLERSDITVEVPVEVNKPWKSKWFWFSILGNVLFLFAIIKKLTKWITFLPI